jgi:hypothetical protein
MDKEEYIYFKNLNKFYYFFTILLILLIYGLWINLHHLLVLLKTWIILCVIIYQLQARKAIKIVNLLIDLAFQL